MSLVAWDEPLSLAEREELLDRLADAVARRGLQTPAVLALEMHRPLAFIASQGLIVAGPLLGGLLGIERVQRVSRLLREPGALDALLARIENARNEPA